MTAGPYAAATGLIERFAGAFAHAVPADPRDDGFFGPASLTWQVNADLSAPVAGLRALLLPALHPLVMAGVDQHSSWQLDPAGRLAATSGHVAAVAYGDRDTARRAAQRVRAVHQHVAGVLIPGASVSTQTVVDQMAIFYDTVREPGPRTMTGQYAAAVASHFVDLRSPLAAYVQLPQSYLILQHINLSLYALLGELSATADWRRITEEIWPFMQAPPSTPIGTAEAAWRAEKR